MQDNNAVEAKVFFHFHCACTYMTTRSDKSERKLKPWLRTRTQQLLATWHISGIVAVSFGSTSLVLGKTASLWFLCTVPFNLIQLNVFWSYSCYPYYHCVHFFFSVINWTSFQLTGSLHDFMSKTWALSHLVPPCMVNRAKEIKKY